ncbi:MAG: glycosyltransferase family 4 protein [Pseudaminobacter sp.]
MAAPRPDRVVVINDRSAPVGGASHLSQLSARLIKERGVPVTFIAGDMPEPDQHRFEVLGAGGETLLQQSRASAFSNGLYNRAALRLLADFIDSRDTDRTVYHLHGWSKILSPSIFRALAGVRQRVVLHAHDYFLVCPNGGFAHYPDRHVCDLTPMSAKCLATQCDKRGYSQKLWRSARHALRQRLFGLREQAANIVVVHEKMIRYFERAGAICDDIVAIRNPFEPPLAHQASPWLSRDFFFIGRLEPEKGFEDAAEAAERAGVGLQVIGDGAGRELLARKYPSVVIHGWKSKAELARIVTDARAVVISSRVPEPFSLAAVEAVGSGIPVILPAEALIASDIVETRSGLTFRAGDIASLASAMSQLVASDDLVREISMNGFRVAPQLGNSPKQWGDALMSLYCRILGDPKGAVSPARANEMARVGPNPFGQCVRSSGGL